MPLIKKVFESSKLSVITKRLRILYYRVRHKKWFYAAWTILLGIIIANILFSIPDIVLTILPESQFGVKLNEIFDTKIRFTLTGLFTFFYTLCIILRPIARGAKWFYILWTSLAAIAIGGVLAIGIILTPEPEKKITSVIGGIILCCLIARWLVLGIIAILILTATILYESIIPKPLTFGGMGFGLSEMLLMFMLSLLMMDIGANRRSDIKSPLIPPLLLLFVSILISIGVSVYSNIDNRYTYLEFKDIYNTARPLFLYLFFFVVAFGIRTERQMRIIINAAIFLAVIVSILLIIQYFLGTHVKVFFGTPWSDIRVEGLEQDKSIVRSMPPGSALILILFPATLCLSFSGSNREKLFYRIACFFLGMGLIFGFSRSAWLSLIITIPIIWILVNRYLKWRILIFSTITILAVILSCIFLSNMAPGSSGEKFSNALMERFTSIFAKETRYDKGIQNRIIESREALQKIKKNPIFGIGVGNPIRNMRWILPDGRQG
jgi:O-antigen ligase